LVGDTQPTLCLGQQHHPAVRRDPSAIEGGSDFLPRDRWQVEGRRDILIH
jgi:hypothetical protein